MLWKLLWVFMGGGVGSVGRVGLMAVVNRLTAGPTFLGTMAVNLAGCFLFGLIWSIAARRGQLDAVATLAALGGFMGAFTTFSTFAFEGAQLLRQGQYIFLAADLLAQNLLGLALVLSGMALGRLVAGV